MATNIKMLQVVANGLEELKNEVIFVGGSVAALYADDPASSDIRATLDVDCVVELSTLKAYYDLEEKLRAKGFKNDTTQGAPICRWIYKDIIVDIMPIDVKILGFGNQWYKPGINHKIEKILPNGASIFLLPIEYYVATKFEALIGRSSADLRQSHDFEDIIYIIDNADKLSEIINNSIDIPLKTYLSEQASRLLKNNNIKEAISCALPLYSDEERIAHIILILERIRE